MTAATDLWEAVKGSYDNKQLVTLTNIHDRSKTGIDEDVGDDAALSVINIWIIYAQVAYDEGDALHVEVGKRAVIAMLWERGGISVTIARQAWDEVFTDGVVERLKRTGPRSRMSPASNSNVSQHSGLLSDGTRPEPWADTRALPLGIMPIARSSRDA